MNTPLNESNMDNLKEIEQIGKDFKNDYKLLTLQISNIINRFHKYILIPTLQEKTTECITKIDFLDDNKVLYIAIKTNDDVLPDEMSLPDGYTDLNTFLTDYETVSTYKLENCEDEYKVDFHTNMAQFYSADELTLVRSMYDNIITFRDNKITDDTNNGTDIFDISTRLNNLISTLLSTLG